jgi:hypothetical protein
MLYLFPCQLPGAGTRVVILPLVVFDQCHLAITAVPYRAAMGILPELRKLAGQRYF